MHLLLQVVWFILPAGCANMAPVFAARLFPRWNQPVDFGKSIGGIRVFGDHKTVRGLVAGVVTGALVGLVQSLLWSRSTWLRSISIFDYGHGALGFGALLGGGALLGDLVKSFCKRRVGRRPGQPWFPFDQIDWVLGALAVSYPFVHPTPAFVLATLGITFVLTLVLKWLGYVVRIGEEPI